MSWVGEVVGSFTGARVRRRIAQRLAASLTLYLQNDFANSRVRGFRYHGRDGRELYVTVDGKDYAIEVQIIVTSVDLDDLDA